MKKLISLLLAIVLSLGICVSFTSCTDKEIDDFIGGIEDIVTSTDSITDESPEATDGQEATQKPTATPKVTATKKPTATPKATATEKPTATPKATKTPKITPTPTIKPKIDENGTYDDKDNVAEYIRTYGKLPKNYMTKAEAEALGWTGGALDKVVKGYAIGGDYFGNYEKILPTNTKYNECDIDTIGKSSRGVKRIIFSKDGHIYYTEDHYETFTEYTEDGTWK